MSDPTAAGTPPAGSRPGGPSKMSPRELLGRSREALRIGEVEMAEQLLLRLAAERPTLATVHVLLGNIRRSRKETKEALREYGRALELDRNNVEALNNLGVVLKDLGRTQDAVASFQSALEIAGERADIRYNLGNTYKEARNYSRAIEEFERAIRADVSFVLAYTNLGTVYQALGKAAEARSVLMQGLSADSNNPTLRYNLGIIARDLGDLKEAKEQFTRALRFRPGWPDALNNLGVVELALADRKSAVHHFREVIKREPNHAKALNNLGVAHSELGDAQAAQRYLALAVQADSGYQRAFLNLGSLMEDQGYPERAAIAYRQLVNLSPQDITARLRLANALIATGRHDEAIAQLSRILESQPEHAAALRALGNAYQRKGDLDRARVCYRQLDKVAPADVDYHMDLALYWQERKDARQAEAEVRRYLAGNRKNIDARLLLGRLLLDQGRNGDATDVFREVTESDPASAEPYYYLARAYHKAGQTESAVATLERLVALQGGRGESEDLTAIGRSLDLHEKLIAEYESQFRERWRMSLSRLRESRTDSGDQTAPAEEGPIEGAAQLIADSVPIISIGGLEPPLVVEEEEEILDLTQAEAEPEERTLRMDRVPPPTVVTLVTPQDRRPEPAEAYQRPAPQHYQAPPPYQAYQPPLSQAAPPPAAQQAAAGPAAGPMPFIPPVIVTAAQQPESSEALQRQQRMLADMQDELRMIRKVLAERQQPVRVTLRAPRAAAVAARPAAAPGPKPEASAGSAGEGPLSPRWSKAAGLMDYLAGLAEYLPDKQRKRFDASDVKLRLEYIRERLRGASGLMSRLEGEAESERAGARGRADAPGAPEVTVSSEKVAGALRFLKGLTALLPGRKAAGSLESKLDSVIVRIEDK